MRPKAKNSWKSRATRLVLLFELPMLILALQGAPRPRATEEQPSQNCFADASQTSALPGPQYVWPFGMEEAATASDTTAPQADEPEPGFVEIEPEDMEEGEPIAPLMDMIDATSAVVYNFADLRDALSADNGINTVYLGADIIMTGGISIHRSKKYLVVDGMNPNDPEMKIHRITDVASADAVYTIRIDDNDGTKNLTVRNMNITGKNYYGTFCVFVGIRDVVVRYENVRYTGPQLVHNPTNGEVYFFDCDISIVSGNGGSPVQELAEVSRAYFGGTVNVFVSNPAINSCLWLYGASPSVEILPGADVTITTENSYLVFAPGGNFGMHVGQGAKLKIDANTGICFGDQAISNLVIDEGGQMDVYQRARGNVPAGTVNVSGSVSVRPGGALRMRAEYAPASALIRFMANNAGASFDDPETVVLSNTNGKLFDWLVGSGQISIGAQVLNYHTSAPSLAQLESFQRQPTHLWWKKSGENVTASATVSSSATTNVSSNIIYGTDTGPNVTASTLNMISVRMLALGRLRLSILNQPIFSTMSEISGETAANANVILRYETTRSVAGKARDDGTYSIVLPEYENLFEDSDITVTSHSDYKIRSESAHVYPPPGEISFKSVPETLSFGKEAIRNEAMTMRRQDPAWSIVIFDTRQAGSEWEIRAGLISPISGVDEGGQEYHLPGSIVLVDGQGNREKLTGDMVPVFGGNKGAEDETALSWAEDRGLLVDIPYAPLVQKDVDYRARIAWVLIDAP